MAVKKPVQSGNIEDAVEKVNDLHLEQSFLEELERTVALLAFEDVNNSPVGDLLDISQHLKTASEVRNGGSSRIVNDSNASIDQFETIFFKIRPAIKLDGFTSRQLSLNLRVVGESERGIVCPNYPRCNGRLVRQVDAKLRVAVEKEVKLKYDEKDKGRPRMNEQISAQYVRIVTVEGHGVVSRHEALERARRHNVDLVDV
uniref:Translation initiation factor 3 N-terminal domain-containing protein n=1 Tax=Lactuca sativa TaxID=4236 RepID=A0A9R1UTJ4_LACSA|nr:hypothetical protein LSAT_V11C800438580 [Lactuca sativa]